MTRIELLALEKRFTSDAKAVTDLSLRIDPGEYLVLLGSSGCGKTTTLRMIAGLTEPSSGEIRFDDEVVNRLPPRRRNVAMVFQEQALLPHLTIQRNLSFGLRLRFASKNEIRRRVQDVTELLGIRDLMNRYPDELSGGERQRVALGAVLVRRPRICLLDEPLSHLDAPMRQQLQWELRRICTNVGCTTIHVTHDQAEAINLADRLAVMHEGRIVQCGNVQQILQHPATRFVAQFVGSPTMSFWSARASAGKDGNAQVTSGDFQWGVSHARVEKGKLAASQLVTVGLRPRFARIVDDDIFPDELTCGGTVLDIQRMEDSRVISVKTSFCGQLLVLASGQRICRGDQVTLALNANRLHLFSGDTIDGENLLRSDATDDSS